MFSVKIHNSVHVCFDTIPFYINVQAKNFNNTLSIMKHMYSTLSMPFQMKRIAYEVTRQLNRYVEFFRKIDFEQKMFLIYISEKCPNIVEMPNTDKLPREPGVHAEPISVVTVLTCTCSK